MLFQTTIYDISFEYVNLKIAANSGRVDWRFTYATINTMHIECEPVTALFYVAFRGAQ